MMQQTRHDIETRAAVYSAIAANPELTNQQIAERFGVAKGTIIRWGVAARRAIAEIRNSHSQKGQEAPPMDRAFWANYLRFSGENPKNTPQNASDSQCSQSDVRTPFEGTNVVPLLARRESRLTVSDFAAADDDAQIEKIIEMYWDLASFGEEILGRDHLDREAAIAMQGVNAMRQLLGDLYKVAVDRRNENKEIVRSAGDIERRIRALVDKAKKAALQDQASG